MILFFGVGKKEMRSGKDLTPFGVSASRFSSGRTRDKKKSWELMLEVWSGELRPEGRERGARGVSEPRKVDVS